MFACKSIRLNCNIERYFIAADALASVPMAKRIEKKKATEKKATEKKATEKKATATKKPPRKRSKHFILIVSLLN